MTPPSGGGVSGWVGVQLSSFHGALSSGGSFYYHAPMTASGAAPPIGPERGGTRVMVLGGGFRDAYTLRCAFGNASAPVLARYVDESQLECSSPVHAAGVRGRAALDERPAVRAERRVVHVPAVGVGELHLAVARARGGRHAADGARRRLLVGVGVARRADVPHRRRGASRAVGERGRDRVQRDARAAGEARVEVSNNAREYSADAARLQLASVRVLDVQPWSGPRLAARRCVSVARTARGRAVTALPLRRGARRRRAWSGGASRLRCVTPPSSGGVSGWVGVQLSSFHGALSSGGSFYYHAALTASGAAPPLGPERGGTRVTVLGGGFRDAYTLRCAFRQRVGAGARAVRRRVAARVRVAGARVGHRGVQLSMNGQQYAPSGVSYTYQPSASVSYISPSAALAEGGTPLTVHGGGFSSASEALGVLRAASAARCVARVGRARGRSCATRRAAARARCASR